MTKLHVAWIVLIVFASLISFAAIFYLFYRLYINRVYKRQRFWKEITSPSKNLNKEKPLSTPPNLLPRVSLVALIQGYLTPSFRKPGRPRTMVTHLHFHEPPYISENFKSQWDAMDTRSRSNIFLSTILSNTHLGIFSVHSSNDASSYHSLTCSGTCDDTISTNNYFSLESYNGSSTDDGSSSDCRYTPITFPPRSAIDPSRHCFVIEKSHPIKESNSAKRFYIPG